jgi:hypothetical protein
VPQRVDDLAEAVWRHFGYFAALVRSLWWLPQKGLRLVAARRHWRGSFSALGLWIICWQQGLKRPRSSGL